MHLFNLRMGAAITNQELRHSYRENNHIFLNIPVFTQLLRIYYIQRETVTIYIIIINIQKGRQRDCCSDYRAKGKTAIYKPLKVGVGGRKERKQYKTNARTKIHVRIKHQHMGKVTLLLNTQGTWMHMQKIEMGEKELQ